MRRAKFKTDDEVAALAAANTAPVNGTLIDSDGQEWVNATWHATPISPSSRPLFLDGTPVPTFSGQLDTSGFFTGVIGLTSMMQPAGVMFSIEIHSVTSAPPSVVSGVMVTSSPFNLGDLLSPRIQAPRINAAPLVYAYNETEIIGATNGSGFINTTNAEAFLFVGGVWTPLTTGGPAPSYPAAGIAISTGTGWGPSIDPATLATYPAAGVAVSSGSAWTASINPATLATYPAAGVAVSSGSAWAASIPTTNVALLDRATNNIFALQPTYIGLGGPSGAISDLNNLAQGGVFVFSIGVTNSPPVIGWSYYWLWSVVSNPTNILQIAWPTDGSGNMFERQCSNGGWTAWLHYPVATTAEFQEPQPALSTTRSGRSRRSEE